MSGCDLFDQIVIFFHTYSSNFGYNSRRKSHKFKRKNNQNVNISTEFDRAVHGPQRMNPGLTVVILIFLLLSLNKCFEEW